MKLHLLTGSALVALVISSSVSAQEASSQTTGTKPAAAQDVPAGDITVTGIRRSNNIAISTKRAATNIVDSVAATDVRALPDSTIVEALQRVPGLSVLPATDNEHPRDEAATPVIRGLGPNYNNVTLDGLQIASPGTPNGTLGSITRGVRLDILPSSMISQLDVVKTFTPDLDPNAVGGAVNIITRSAFADGGRPFFTAEGSLGYTGDHGKPRDQADVGERFSATGSTTFGSEHQFGLTLSGNYQQLSSFTDSHMTTDTTSYNFYNSAGVLQTGNNLGNGYAVPQQDKYWYVQDKRTRYGLTGKFEAKISDALSGFVTLGYYYFKDNMQRNENTIGAVNMNTVSNQTATSGTYAGGRVEVGYENSDIISRTKVAQAGMDWRPDERQHLSARFGASRATYDETFSMIKYTTGAVRSAVGTGGTSSVDISPLAFTYNTSSLNHSFNVDPSAYYNLSNYTLGYYRPYNHRFAGDDVLTGRLDYDFNRGADAQGFGFGVGASYTDDRPSFNLDRTDYEPNTSQAAISLATALGPTGAALKYNTAGLNLLTINPTAATAQIAALAAAGGLNQTDQSGYNNQDDFEHVEKIFGAYGLVSYRSDAVSAEAGFHLDHTDQQTTGRIKTAAGWGPNRTGSKYTYVLPSAIATWHTTKALDLKAAFSQTIGRPAYDSYAARSSITFATTGDMGNPNATNVSVTVGNPNIKPRLSTNYDIAANYYLSNKYGGLISLAGFYKNIKDEIFTQSTQGYTYQGVTYVNALVSQPMNASSANIKGIEANAIVNSLGFISPWLKSIGASANYSLLDGHMTIPAVGTTAARTLDRLVGQPNYIANASIFYSHNGLELRGAWVRKGSALRAVVTNSYWQDLYWAPRSQIDLSASYTLRNGVAVVGQVSNVTHSRLTSLMGPGRDLLKDSYSVPTTFWLGIRITPKIKK